MATNASQAIDRALRRLLIIGEGASANFAEATDGLTVLNLTLRGLFGDQIGVKLEPVAASTTTGQYGAMYQGIGAAYTLTLPDNPKDGWRIGTTDAANAFASFNATIARNGRLLEGAASNLVLSTNGTSRIWFFRSDTGNWERERDLVLSDNIYLADDCMTGFIAILAIAIANEYGKEAPPTVVAEAQRGDERLRIRYGRRGTFRQAMGG